MVQVSDSSNISAVDWNGGVLIVTFRDGSQYQYLDVSYDVFHEFLAAPSKGKFLHSSIKGRFESSKLG